MADDGFMDKMKDNMDDMKDKAKDKMDDMKDKRDQQRMEHDQPDEI